MNIFVKTFIVLALIAGLFVIVNWGKLQRLHKVNSLFDENNIVHNFSNMNELLFYQDLPADGAVHQWPENRQNLPEKVMIDDEPRNLQAFLDETRTTALLVIKDGVVLHEDYYLGTHQDDRRISWSMAKSFLSALMGIAVEDGRIKSLDDRVTDYVPSLKGSAYDGASIRNVLNMASGVAFNEDYLDPKSDINKMGRVLALGGSMDKFAASLKERARPPGTERQYVSIDTHVAAMVLRSATGQSLSDFFVENLWSNIGPGKDAYYSTDGEGAAFALGGLNMRTRDYALFGQLMMQGGRWDDEQIIPNAWVKESTQNSAPGDAATDMSGVGYGYQWWVPADSFGDFFAVGIYEQYIYIDPTQRVVIVKNSANRQFKEPGQSGKSYKLESIDLFRSLAAHYSDVD